MIDYKKIFSLTELVKTMTRIENIALVAIIGTIFTPIYKGFILSDSDVFIFYLIILLSVVIVVLRPIIENEKTIKNLKFATGALILYSAFFVFGDGLRLFLFATFGILVILGTLDKVQLPFAKQDNNTTIEDSEK